MDSRNFTYLCYGLITAWAVLLVYVLTLASRERRIQKDLADLRALVGEKERR